MNDTIARAAGMNPAFAHREVDPAKGHHRGVDQADEDDDGWAQRTFRKLTPEEAAIVRSRNPVVSPWRVVGAQAIAGAVCTALAWAFAQQPAAGWSALYGAAAAVLPSALLARGMTRGASGAVAAAAGFMFWEMLKIGVAIAMLMIAAKVVPNLSWPVLLATMVVCIKVNWVALCWGAPDGKRAGHQVAGRQVTGHLHGN